LQQQENMRLLAAISMCLLTVI